MAYKFQLGKAKLSGSIEVAEKLKVDAGGLEVAGTVTLDNGEIDNVELANSEITVNGYATALGSSVTLGTDDVAEGSNNLYWTEARFDASLATKDTGDLAEGSNLYYTDARVHDALSAGAGVTYDGAGEFSISAEAITNEMLAGSIASSKIAELNSFDTGDLAEGSNLYWTVARGESMFDDKLAAASTSDLAEGDNLYYTDGRVHAAVSAGDGLTYDGAGQFAVTSSIAGAGLAWNAGVLSVDTAEIAAGLSGSVENIVKDFIEASDFVTFDDATGTISVDAAKFSGSFDAALATKDTGDLAEGSNLYWTTARGESMFDTRLATKSTSDLAEGSNLYYTDARVHAAVSAVDAGGDGSFSYDAATGVFTYTGPSDAEARAHFSGGDFIAYNPANGKFGVSGSIFTGSVRSSVGVATPSGLSYDKSTGLFAVSSSIAGEALDLVGGVLNVKTDNSSVEVFGDALRVKSLGITNSMLSGGIQNAKLANSSVEVIAGGALSGGGIVALGGNITLNVEVNGDALEVTGDQIALKSTISGDRTFSNNVTVTGDLTVNGTTTYINTTNLVVEDALITIASGSAFAAGQGIEFGTAHSLQTAVVGGVNVLSSSLPLLASTVYGNLVGSMQLGIEAKSVDATIAKNVTKAMSNITLTLPSSPTVGQEHRVKCFVADTSSPAVVVQAQAGGTIEGESQVVLQSYGAAVSLVWDGSMWMIF